MASLCRCPKKEDICEETEKILDNCPKDEERLCEEVRIREEQIYFILGTDFTEISSSLSFSALSCKIR